VSGGNGKKKNGARIEFPDEMLNGNGGYRSPSGRYSVSRKGMGGRPTKYDPAMCELVTECMADGYTRHMVLREIYLRFGMKSYSSLLDYEKDYPEFRLALKEGEELSRGWWERKGHENLTMSNMEKFNTGPYALMMVNKFGYRSARVEAREEIKTETVQSGRVEHVLKLEGVSDEVLKQLITVLSGARTAEGKPIAAEPIRDTLH
jgi:hypothetical protein